MKSIANEHRQRRSWHERLSQPESELGPLEPAYRQSIGFVDLDLIQIVVAFYLAVVVLYTINDYKLFGPSPALWLAIGARIVLIATPVIILFYANRLTPYTTMDRLVFFGVLVSDAMNLYLIYIRPESPTYLELLIVLVNFLIVPNRFYYRLIPALLFSLGDFMLYGLLRPPAEPPGLVAVGIALVMVNVTGLLTSVRLNSYRRHQFRAQREIVRLAADLQRANESLEEKVRDRTAELAKANQQLQELDRLKSDFLGVVTHELRSPFVNITFDLQLIARYGVDHLVREQREQFQLLTTNVQTAKAMIENLVKVATFLSKQGDLHLTPIDLGPLIDQAVMPLQFQADRKELSLRIDHPVKLPEVRGDADRLSEAIYHLADNAIKFTASGGEVSVRCWADHNLINFAVKDNGAGVPADKLPTLWDSFSQMADPLKRGTEGLGLGLALVKYIVTAHGGSVWAESQVGVGSTFGFRLPISALESARV
jgi:signal transduction histidine kinase